MKTKTIPILVPKTESIPEPLQYKRVVLDEYLQRAIDIMNRVTSRVNNIPDFFKITKDFDWRDRFRMLMDTEELPIG